MGVIQPTVIEDSSAQGSHSLSYQQRTVVLGAHSLLALEVEPRQSVWCSRGVDRVTEVTSRDGRPRQGARIRRFMLIRSGDVTVGRSQGGDLPRLLQPLPRSLRTPFLLLSAPSPRKLPEGVGTHVTVSPAELQGWQTFLTPVTHGPAARSSQVRVGLVTLTIL